MWLKVKNGNTINMEFANSIQVLSMRDPFERTPYSEEDKELFAVVIYGAWGAGTSNDASRKIAMAIVDEKLTGPAAQTLQGRLLKALKHHGLLIDLDMVL